MPEVDGCGMIFCLPRNGGVSEPADVARHAQPIGHKHSLSGCHSRQEVLTWPLDRASSLILLGMFRICTPYACIVQQTSGYALGIGAAREGRVGYVETFEGEEVFFVTFILFFVSMTV